MQSRAQVAGRHRFVAFRHQLRGNLDRTQFGLFDVPKKHVVVIRLSLFQHFPGLVDQLFSPARRKHFVRLAVLIEVGLRTGMVVCQPPGFRRTTSVVIRDQMHQRRLQVVAKTPAFGVRTAKVAAHESQGEFLEQLFGGVFVVKRSE